MQIVEADPQGPAALALLREAAIEARALYPEDVDADTPWPTNPPTAPGGVFLLAVVAGQPSGCAALRAIDVQVAEVRRMFVTRAARRCGLARALLGALEEHARRLGYTTLRLETGERQAAAIALYQSHGYRPIAPYGPHVGDATSRCFEKRLGQTPSGVGVLN
jgi:GNAT superfamily N-acetyltransferase